MTYTIQNDIISLTIDTQGAEMVKIQDAKGKDFLWDAKPEIWARHAPILFPIVGKLTNNTYKLGEESYHLPQHGFARDQAFTIAQQSKHSLEFFLHETENTLKVYPFPFQLSVKYKLEGNGIITTYTIKNTGNDILPFSIGAHPAFMLQPEIAVEEYYLEFEHEESGTVHPLREGLIQQEATKHLPFVNRKLYLSEELFQEDALIFSHLRSEWIALVHEASHYRVQVSTKGFPWVGIWAKENVPFVCIEPWQGHADFIGHNQNFLEKSGVMLLAAGQSLSCSYSINVQ
jgi:galactose mutarotase-like enzyme